MTTPLTPQKTSAATRLLFHLRVPALAILGAISVLLAISAAKLEFRPGFEKMIPTGHPYIQNYFKHREIVEGANFVQIAVAVRDGDIFSADYLATLQVISDEVFLLPGVDRPAMKSLWTKNVQWIAVTDDGFEGGVVIPNDYDGTPGAVAEVRSNVVRSGEVGQLVANIFTSSLLFVPLLDVDPETNEQLDYWVFSRQLDDIRVRYESDQVSIHIVGFAKLIGDLLDGMVIVAGFFGVACLTTMLLMYAYTRCLRVAVLPVFCSLVGVVWQLGILRLFGYGLDPFNMLVPFLIFAVGVSHGVQMLNSIATHQGLGHAPLPAAMFAFSSIAGAGLSAILSDALGFLTLLLIPVQVIRELGIAATIGVLALAATSLALLPLLLSFVGMSRSGVKHAARLEGQVSSSVRITSKVVTRGPAAGAITVGVLLAIGGLIVGSNLKIGDLESGASELRPNARYNQDVRHIVNSYSTSSDVMILMVETGEYECVSFETLDIIDRLQWRIEELPSVQSTDSAVNAISRLAVLLNEGNFRMWGLPREQAAIFSNLYAVPEGRYYNPECDLGLVYITLDDRRAETLRAVISELEAFIASGGERTGTQILLAGGNAGIEAATNQVIEQSRVVMLIAIYTAVALIILLTFRSFKAVICIVVPLGITSILAQALMVMLGIGVKVSTLPVIALGVGIGVDYGIYIFNLLNRYLNEGVPIQDAYLRTLKGAGKAVVYTALALAIGTAIWVFSPIKFQADMGVLLTFMFLWNMVGALTLSPALAYYLRSREDSAVAVPASR